MIKNANDLASLLKLLDPIRQFALLELLELVENRLPELIQTWDQLQIIQQSLGKDKPRHQFVCHAAYHQLQHIVTSTRKLGIVLASLDEERCASLLENPRIQLQLPKDRPQLILLLKRLDKKQCRLALKAIKKPLREMIQNVAHLAEVLQPLNKVQRRSILKALKKQLPDMIQDIPCLLRVLRIKDEPANQNLLEALEPRLPALIENWYNLKFVLEPLSPANRGLVLKAITAELPSILEKEEQCSELTQSLGEANRELVLAAMKPSFSPSP